MMTLTRRLLVLATPALLLACVKAAPPAAAPSSVAAPSTAAAAAPSPPVARRIPHPETLHGLTRDDDYYWLRDKGTPAVEAYLRAENDYTAAVMKPTEPFQRALYDELLARVKETDVSVPTRDHGYYYYSRTEKGQQYSIWCRKSATGAAPGDLTGDSAVAPEEVLLDLNELGRRNAFVSLGPKAVSDDGTLLAYALDTTGFRQYTLRFKDLAGRRRFAEEIARVDAVAWAADGRTVFYVVEDPVAKRPSRLYRHSVGSDPAGDALVYEEKDERYELDLYRTRSRGWLVATSESKTTTEVRVLAADRPAGAWSVVEPRQKDVRYYVDHRGDRFYLRTDAPAKAGGARARNFRLVSAPVASPGRAHWRELVAQRDDVMLEDIDLFAGQAVLSERADALPRLRVLALDGAGGVTGAAAAIPMPETVYAVSVERNPEFEATSVRFSFQSPVTPESIYDYDVRTRAVTLRKRQEVLGGYDPARYTSARLHATAADGTRIPISIVYRKELTPATPHPLMMLGYGSYGFPLPVKFSSDRLSLLDRGVVFAFAHVRGGGELGQGWHDQGRVLTKMNTFTDFIACAEALVGAGWTRSDRLVITGRSAGGLLMGAVTNLRPDLWKAVLAQVPFVDVMNTMVDDKVPLTAVEYEEWGNPQKRAEYDAMMKYSPYDNVERKAYPALLVMTSYNDSQVMYWEPAKWVARLRVNKTDRNPLLLKVNMEPAGHSGQSGRYDQLRETAFMYAWVLQQLGLTH